MPRTSNDWAESMNVGAESDASHFRAKTRFKWHGKEIKPGQVFDRSRLEVAPHKVPSMVRAGLIEAAPKPVRKKSTKKAVKEASDGS